MAHLNRLDQTRYADKKNKELYLLLKTPPWLHAIAIELSGDKQYWRNDKIMLKWSKYCDAREVERLGVEYFESAAVCLNILTDVGLVNENNKEYVARQLKDAITQFEIAYMYDQQVKAQKLVGPEAFADMERRARRQ